MAGARFGYLMLAVVAIGLGLAVRQPGLGLSPFAAKYGGAVVWAMMVYFLVRAVAPRLPLLASALLAGAIAWGWEATQLIDAEWFDTIRATRWGQLVFGRTFAMEDVIAYWIGIAVAALLEATHPSRERPGTKLVGTPPTAQ